MNTSTKKLEIKFTDLDHHVFDQRDISSNSVEDYTFYSLTIYNEISINGKEFTLEYATGGEFEHNDYNLPSMCLSINEGGGDEQEYLLNYLLDNDFSKSDIKEVEKALKENFQAAKRYSSELIETYEEET